MTKILGVGGLLIKSPDPEALYAWYSRCLGTDDDGASSARAPVREANVLCSIIDGESSSFDHGRKDFAFKLIVEDVDETLRAVADEGGTVVGESRTENGMRLGWFIDPEGNRVELWQPELN